MFIAALTLRTKLANQTGSTDRLTGKEICYIYTHNRVLVSHKNEIILFVGKWLHLETSMLSERSQGQKDSQASLVFSSESHGILLNAFKHLFMK